MHTLILGCLFAGLIEFWLVQSGSSTTITPYTESEQDPVLNISEDSVSWYMAIQSGDTLVNEDHISKHGWESIVQYIPEDEKVWIAARAGYTPFVSWEGCARWTGDLRCEDNVIPGGSIGNCTRNCTKEGHFLLLMGTKCRCVPKQDIDTCIQHTTDRCDTPCQNNPNDWCGGQNSMALYNTGPFGIKTTNATDSVHTNGIVKKKCVLLINSKLQTNPCNSPQVRRYICGDGTAFKSIDKKGFLTWPMALNLCNRFNQHLYYKIDGENYSRTAQWTSIKRSVDLKWTNTSDESFPFCVSVTRDNTSELFIREDICERQYRYLVLKSGENLSGTEDKKSLISIYIYVGLAIVLVVFLSIMAVIIYQDISRRRQKPVAIKDNREQPLMHRSSPVTSRSLSTVPKDGASVGDFQEDQNYDRAGRFRRGDYNELPTNVYHTFATATVANDTDNQSVYNTFGRREESESFYYDHATNGRYLNANSDRTNDSFYNVCGAMMPPVENQTSVYDTTMY